MSSWSALQKDILQILPCKSLPKHAALFWSWRPEKIGALRANKATSGCSADFVIFIFNIAGAHQKVCRRANVDDVDASNLEVCLPISIVDFMTRPACMNALTKFTVKSTRVAIRQAIALITLLLENIADEVIYQLEFALRCPAWYASSERSPTFSCVNYCTSCAGWSQCYFCLHNPPKGSNLALLLLKWYRKALLVSKALLMLKALSDITFAIGERF